MKPTRFARVTVNIRRNGRIVHQHTVNLDQLRSCHNGQYERNCFPCLILENIERHILPIKAGDICLFFPPDDSGRRRFFWWGRYRVIRTEIYNGTVLIVDLDGSESSSWETENMIANWHIGKIIELRETGVHYRVLRYSPVKNRHTLLNLDTGEEEEAPIPIRFSVMRRMP